jgi:hypothetical protein
MKYKIENSNAILDTAAASAFSPSMYASIAQQATTKIDKQKMKSRIIECRCYPLIPQLSASVNTDMPISIEVR